jgi:hypothetical protein
MAKEPIKFRCFQCQKLLGVSPSKAGAVVSCPKCGAGLLVPDLPPEGEPAAFPVVNTEPVNPAPTGTSPGEFAGLDLSELRLDESPAMAALRTAAPETTQQPSLPGDGTSEGGLLFPPIEVSESSLRSDPTRRLREPLEPRINDQVFAPLASTVSQEVPRNDAVTVEARPVTAADVIATQPVIPATISAAVVETPAQAPAPEAIAAVQQRSMARRRDDVVLPRVVVQLWSFFVVLALGFAFAAGLLWGRFLWLPRAGPGP